MSSDPETTNESSASMELDLGDDLPTKETQVKKTARKTARKTTRKVARKTVDKEADKKAEDQESPSESKVSNGENGKGEIENTGEFRPSDFKGRGSHFDDSDPVEVVDAAESSDSQAEKDNPSDGASSGESQSSGGGQRDQRQGNNRQHNKNQRFQKKKTAKKGKRGSQRDNRRQGGGWHQPPPPRESDQLEGSLPAAQRFAKFEDTAALVEQLDLSIDPVELIDLYELHIDELIKKSVELGYEFEEKPSRKQILEKLFSDSREKKRAFKDQGFLDLADEGHGYIVHAKSNYQLKPESVYVPASLIGHYSLKRGHYLEILAQPPEEGERCPAAIKIESAMDAAPEEVDKVTPFTDLIPYYPLERVVLETPMPSNSKKDVSMRAFDLLTPIGFGQRGLIVAPPRTGKTVLLQGLANSIQENYPDTHLIVLLIDERPEEVTDFKRRVKGEVVSSTFDEAPTSHVHAAEMVVEKARRMVEHGKDVVILLDSITRLARAYNALASNSGKIMSGGIEATALQKPKRFFGSARNIEEGGSLTIMGTALVDTGSKMDEVIFEEFKGTGNMELHLDRELINKRIFPAIHFERSGTRKEELLYHPQELEKVYGLRRVMQGVPGVESMEMLIKRLKATKNNVEFLMSLK